MRKANFNFTKLFLIVMMFGFVSHIAMSQLAIKPGLTLPTGYLGALLKKAPTLAIGKIEDFDNRSRSRMLGEITYFSPRRDIYDVYAYVIEGDQETVYPGRQEVKLYLNLTFSMGLDYSIVQKNNFNFYAGADLLLGMTLRSYQLDIPMVKSEGEFSGLPYFGIRGRAGVDYSFENFSLFLEMNRTYYLNSEKFFLSYNDLGIGIRF